MLRYYRLLVVSILMALSFFVVGAIEHLTVASKLAKELAPSIGVDEDLLREHLMTILGRNWIGHGIVYCAPWLFLACYFSLRMVSIRRSRNVPRNAPGT
jgi:hypothetical protein